MLRRLSAAAAVAVASVSVLVARAFDPASDAPVQTKKPATAPRNRTAQMVPFSPGETLTFDVSWSAFLPAGSATLAVTERKPSSGSEAYYIVAEGRPTAWVSRLYDLYYKADTLVDIFSLLPQRGSIFSEEGKRQRTKLTIFDHNAKKACFELHTATVVKKEVAIPAQAQDVLSALYVVRARPFRVGEMFSFPICDAGESYTVQISVGNLETVATGIGMVRAWKLTPVLPANHGSAARQLSLWLS